MWSSLTTIIGTSIQKTLPIIKNILRLRIEVWSLSITVVSQKTLTAKCFQKDPKDDRAGVKTRIQSANQAIVSTEDYEYYFQKKQRIKQWISGTKKYTTKASDQSFIV